MAQRRTVKITEQMVALFDEGCALQASGDHERWENDRPSGKKMRFIEIEKRLDALLHRGWHGPSLFDSVLDHAPPRYMRSDLAASQDWTESQLLRKALFAELR